MKHQLYLSLLLCVAIGYISAQQRQCGTMKAFFAPNRRIVGGRPAEPYAWPWQVYISMRGRFICGGTIISDRHILTASHCVIGQSSSARDFTVRVGAQSMVSGPYTGTSYAVSTIYVHERYRAAQYGYDIAIFVLTNRVTFSDRVNAACLPPALNVDIPYTELLVITGFGLTREGGSMPYRLLQAVIQPLTTCRRVYSPFYEQTQICAGIQTGGTDTCQGDSGGPLVYRPRGSNQWYVVGVTSYGSGCARFNYPGVYTKVSAYLTWIKQYVR